MNIQKIAIPPNLTGKLYIPKNSNSHGVIFLHGWRSSHISYQQYAESLSNAGYTALIFDMSGMGDNSNDLTHLTRSDFLKEAISAYDILAQHCASISVVGSSFGSYLAVLLVEQRKVSKLVLRVPANYLDEGYDSEPQLVVSDRLDKLGDKITLPNHATMATRALSKFEGGVMIISSEHDEIIANSTIQGYIDAKSPGEITHIEIKGASHSISRHPDFKLEFESALVKFITS